MRSAPSAIPKCGEICGISPTKIILISMMISGALAGMMALNNVMGEAERLVLNATEGAGFIGIAVALMGRSHPFGVLLAALLFGALYQGGAILNQDTTIPVQLVLVIQALVILFTGALDNMVRMPLERLFLRHQPPESGPQAQHQGGGVDPWISSRCCNP
jgi:general nucleoside transport system permease protein